MIELLVQRAAEINASTDMQLCVGGLGGGSFPSCNLFLSECRSHAAYLAGHRLDSFDHGG